jgi:GAF domain-containing protein/anti-sigma regulatory factor (Ser/Thr protein kinase)
VPSKTLQRKPGENKGAQELRRLCLEVERQARELSEARQQQLATAEVLKAISRSDFDLQAVLTSLIESAARLCGANFGQIFRWDGTSLRWAAGYAFTPEFLETQRGLVYRPGRESLVARTALNMRVTIIDDALADPEYAYKEYAKIGNYRTMLGVPLMRSGKLIGVLALVHQHIEPFTDKQIELVTTFADQAVIAIENTRLFEELEARNRELTEALEQQVATGAILRTIAASPTNVDPVLNAVAESAAKLCDAYDVVILLAEGDILTSRAHHGQIPFDVPTWRISPDWVTGRAFIDRKPVHVHDVMQAKKEFPASYAIGERIGFRTLLAVPLLREDKAIGALVMRRREVRPFTQNQIDLVVLFADQAAIAIENTRLFEEVQTRNRELTEALEQQTATGTILRAIAASPTDVQPVLNTVAESAARLCEAFDAVVLLKVGDVLCNKAHYGPMPMVSETHPIGRDLVSGRAVVDRTPVHVHDLLEAADEFPASHELVASEGQRTILAVPLLSKGESIGALFVRRHEVRPFTQRQIDLLVLFADQAAIAIENTRLFEEVQTRNRELTEALEQQTATGTILRAIAVSPTNVEPVLATVAESAARLCEAYDAAILLAQGDVLALRAHHGPIPIDFTSWPVGRDWVTGRAYVDREPVHVHDLTQQGDEFPAGHAMAERLGHRTILAVPLLREDKAIGAMVIRRREVRPFTRKQIDLVVLFAHQATIAIENTRLFEEVQARNYELTEALEQQTATSTILKAIAASPTDVRPVLNTVVESAARLCGAYDSAILLAENDTLCVRAHYGPIPIDRETWPISRELVTGRAFIDRKTIHVHDLLEERGEFPLGHRAARRLGYRTLLTVPLMREDKAIGTVMMRRQEVRPFSEKQVDLLVLFADQAAIAIENARLFEELQTRNRELTEAIERQTATAEVLKAISRATFDLPTVLRTLVASAARLCGATYGGIVLREDDMIRVRALYGGTPEDEADLQSRLAPIDRSRISGRVIMSGHIEQIPDILADHEYDSSLPRISNTRALMGVPLLHKGVVEGTFFLGRPEPGTFTQHQSDLVQTFADQAVIAIENVRLFEEVKARTSELSESLQQQIATADVLKAISRSTFDLEAVLNTLVESAARLCAANIAQIFRWDGACLRWAAGYALGPDYLEIQRERTYKLGRDSLVGRTALEKRTTIILDVFEDPEYAYKDHAKIGQIRTILGVPLLRSGELIGVIALAHQRVEPFTEKQIELVTTFADQAVIAIENARLFEEVQARTRELQETLDYQTAIGEVLNVISRSPSDVQPVLDVILQTAVRLCDADGGTIARERNGQFVGSGQIGFSAEFAELMQRKPVELSRGTATGRTLVEGKVVHILDAATDPEYTWTEALKLADLHTLLGVPLLRDKTPIGVIVLIRRTVRPFTEKQIDLVTTFADQAVIAIENARLFEEVQARTSDLARSVEELKALGEVSQSVNSTLDLKTVLETIVAKAVQLSRTDAGAIYVYSRQADNFGLRATYGMSPELIAAISDHTIRLNEPGIGDAARSRQSIQTEDLTDNAATRVQQLVLAAGFHSVLVVPLLRPNRVIGALVVRRRARGRFSDSTVHLMETFAAQSVLAIQNARLFSEIEEKGHQLEIASRHKSQFLANMSHELRTPLNSVLGFTEMLADGLYGELPEKAKATLGRVQANGRHLLGLINDVLDLSKIEAGQLTLTLDDYLIGQIVKTVAATTEPLARAKGLKLTAAVAEGLPLGRGDERRLSQVLLNLAGNAVKFTEKGSIEITANARDGHFEILVRDTGPGIAPEHQIRIFEEFQQVDDSNTRQKGGTGLGLAISKRIVEMHGGTIGIESVPGSGSTFKITIPIRVSEGMAAA